MIIQAEVIIARNLSLNSKFTDNLLERPEAALCESVTYISFVGSCQDDYTS